MSPGHGEEYGGEGGGGETGHQAAVGLAGPGMAISAGDAHEADQQGVEEGGDTLGSQGPPEGESPDHRSGINLIIRSKNFSLETRCLDGGENHSIHLDKAASKESC